MKKYLILFITTISFSFFVGCEDADDDFNPPNYVTFAENSMNFAVNQNSSGSVEVTIFTANTTGSDRTFTINVEESSTLNSDSYDIPGTVVVPANSNEGTFTVNVTDNSLDDAGDVLVLTVGGGDEFYSGAPLTLNIAKICEFEPVGIFTNNSGWYEQEYNVELVAGATENQYVVKDMFAAGTDITFTVNPDYTITVPKQNAWMHSSYGQASVTGRPGSALSPCTGEATLVLQHTVSAGSFGTYPEVLSFDSAATDGGDTDGGDGDGGDADGGDGDDDTDGSEG